MAGVGGRAGIRADAFWYPRVLQWSPTGSGATWWCSETSPNFGARFLKIAINLRIAEVAPRPTILMRLLWRCPLFFIFRANSTSCISEKYYGDWRRRRGEVRPKCAHLISKYAGPNRSYRYAEFNRRAMSRRFSLRVAAADAIRDVGRVRMAPRCFAAMYVAYAVFPNISELSRILNTICLALRRRD